MNHFRMPAASRNRKGFTLIELLVVVLILAILMAVALPLYLSAVADSQMKTCRANMQTIANAVQAARVKTAAADYGPWITASTITLGNGPGGIPDLNAVPVCPSTGVGTTYTISQGSSASNATFKVNCSYAPTGGTAHGSFEPGVDSK
jgi:type IV pilus assembly protein PilA